MTVAITAPDPGPFAPYLAAVTPHPHPTGDQPLDASQVITLSAYTPPPPIPDPFPAYAEGLRQIYSDILDNPRPGPRSGARRRTPRATNIGSTSTTTAC